MGEKDRDPQVQDVEAKLQIFGYGAIYKKQVPFFTDFSCRLQKKESGSCTHNFDARDLPNS